MDADTDEVRAAGGVVLRPGPGGPEVLVVHRPRYDDWSLPKGKLDPGEDFEGAAIREVEEETGVMGRLGAQLPTTRYRDRHGTPKVVRWWRMHVVTNHHRAADDEVDDVRWLPVDQAPGRLTYAADLDLLARVTAEPPPVSILLVRHAHAGDRSGWNGDDGLRPLSTKGHDQSRRLAAALARYHVQRALSSPLTRCVQTLDPLAHASDTTVDTDDRITEGAPLERTLELLFEVPDGTVLCSHGDVIANVIEHLAATRPVGDLGGTLRWQKASTWALTRTDGEFTAAAYLPPPR